MYVSRVSIGCCRSRCGCCTTCMVQEFHTYVASIFIWMLQAFHMDVAKVNLDVAYVLQWLHTCFKCFHVFCKCFKCMFASILVFGRMLQVFHLDVTKINLVLHMLQWNPHTAIIRCSCWGTAIGHHASP
jgi:hypothetical protein